MNFIYIMGCLSFYIVYVCDIGYNEDKIFYFFIYFKNYKNIRLYDDFKKFNMCCIYVYVYVCIVYINDVFFYC